MRILGLDREKTGIICSGNGLQFFIKTTTFSAEYFKTKKNYYKLLCQIINKNLANAGLKGTADPTGFGAKKLMRMPGTENRKEKGTTQAYIIQQHVLPQAFVLEESVGLEMVPPTEQIAEKALVRLAPPDTKTILKECLFLKHCGEYPGKISEPEWYASLSVLGRLDNGKELAHMYSEGHPGYSEEVTDEKLEQSLMASGPRTCSNINDLWDGCSECPHWEKIKSPIVIQGPDYLPSQANGFYDVVKGGKATPNYNDIHAYFKRVNPYFVQTDTRKVYIYNGKFWEELSHLEIQHFAEEQFSPKPSARIRREFVEKVLANNLRTKSWYENSVDRKICFENGVYDLTTDELLPHSEEYFFTGCLPYCYDPSARSIRFSQFMDEITCGKEDLKRNLLEFAGYAISGDRCWLHKSMIMHGTGRNGKSTFMEVLKNLVGPDLYSSLSLTALEDPAKRYMLVGKHFNVGEETNVHALNKSESFKVMVAGGEVDIKRLYEQPFLYRTRAKLLFACNKLPYSQDNSMGMVERLMIVPFKAVFKNGTANVHLKEQLLEELPGIFNLLIQNYKNLYRRGGFLYGEDMETALDEYQSENNLIIPWSKEVVEITGNEEDFVTSEEVYESFKHFCEARGGDARRYGYAEVIKKMKGLYGDTEDVVKHTQRLRDGSRKRGFSGVKFEVAY